MYRQCPYYEEHQGDCYQGVWQYNDCCHFCKVIDSYSCDCLDNSNCWFRRKEANKEIGDLCEKYFEPSKEYDFMSGKWKTYECKSEVVKDCYMKAIQRITNTLEKLNELD